MGDSRNPCPPPPPRQAIPKDGWGPRGGGDCYYTSRVLNSTGRYVQFVKKLRMQEEEQRIGELNKNKMHKDNEILDFFTKCDRKNRINRVRNQVQICLDAYENDIQEKRNRLMQLLKQEDEIMIIEFTKIAQAGAEAAFQDKMDRLAYLLAKRKKEHEDKYTAIPFDKCTHVHPCIVKVRAKEAQQIQLYQMREKQMRKMSEKEFDKMWHEVAMKESDALAVRIELDTIARLRRDQECLKHSDEVLEERRQARIRERERLKQEALQLKADIEAGNRLEEEKERQAREKAKALQRNDSVLLECEEEIAKAEADKQLMTELWETLARKGLAQQLAEIELRKRMERELDVCNKKLAEMKNRIAKLKFSSDGLILQEGQRIRDGFDYQRCLLREKDKRDKKENQKYILQQIQDKKDSIVTDLDRAQTLYNSQVNAQMDELVKNKQLTDAQAQKLYQNDLRDQIAYNKLLKERALQEELAQRKKYEIAKDEYQEQIKEMLSRPYFSNGVHPFLRKMDSGLKMNECSCAKDWCALPKKAGEASKKQ